MDFDRLWSDLFPIGRSATSGGYRRRPFEAAERECAAWFAEQCLARDMRLEADGNANLVAWWDAAPGAEPAEDAVLTGSHLDSVDDGGAFDGPLGIVSALAAVDLLCSKGFQPSKPIGIVAFAAEEGSRFGVACLGSRLATGALSAETASRLRDRAGVSLGDAMIGAGLEPTLGPAPFLHTPRCFVELHVEQGRHLIDQGSAVGVATGIWPHGRYRFDFSGEANHAGSTRMEDRRDPMLSAAMTVLAANKQARVQDARATFGRLDVQPGSTNAIASQVTGWMDARARSADALRQLVGAIGRLAEERAGRDGTDVRVTAESESPAVAFDVHLSGRIAALGGERPWPSMPSIAGHDAGILAAAGIPTAMLFVRNPTGVSHAPAEHAEMSDCLAGVGALARTLEELAG